VGLTMYGFTRENIDLFTIRERLATMNDEALLRFILDFAGFRFAGP
jgi:hypothetical protein